MISAEFISDYCDSKESEINISTETISRFYKQEQDKINKLLEPKPKSESVYPLRRAMEKILMDKVGIFRNEKDLQSAVDELKELLIRSRNIEVAHKVKSANPELFNAYRTQKMLKISLCVAYGALLRKESRGAHAREDFPERNDKKWLKRTLTTWAKDDDTLPTISYEELDIHSMELPPGFRGYGKDMTIHHADTKKRLDEVDRIKKKMNDKGADRFEIQNELMPYDDKLPKKYRGRNERLEEKFDE
tara:strand:- start:287 stop:1027 length:741 start_codon:yes stop_codon:yes gene_type:complete